MKKLVIVESPTKARTIGRFLGKEYVIVASMGHVMDLPKSTLGVDVDKNFEPQYELVKDKKKIIASLKSAAKSVESIILATDPDREGEAIASHVAELLTTEGRKLKVGIENSKLKIEPKKINLQTSTFKVPSSTIHHLPSITRIVFHEITKEAIDEAFKNPRSIDTHLVDAQTARRVLDRLVGYKLSPLLWKKVRRGLSAGRVQSVALRLIVEREREIEKFGKEKYFTISVVLTQGPVAGFPPASAPATAVQERAVGSPSSRATLRSDSTEFDLIEINGQKIEIQKSFQLYDGEYKISKTTVEKEQNARKIADDLKTKKYSVSDVIKKEMRRSPAPPYTTSTLQQDAARRLGMNGKRTMSLAQKLYEEGYITYHRTDSVAMSQSAKASIIAYVKKEFGEKYIPAKPRFYATRQKLAQEAHEAIRPTAVGQVLSIKYKVLSIAGEQGYRLYELIWKRAVASQMVDAIIESTMVYVIASGAKQSQTHEGIAASPSAPRNDDKQYNIYQLKANGSVLVFDGFLKVNPLGLSDNKLPKFEKDEKLNLVDVLEKEHETLPPPRYNDASLIKSLEEEGIGRPSTYANIVSTIESRQYIERQEGRFMPTSIGIAVNDFLVLNFSDIDDIPFTASMEDDLDNIASSKKEWIPMIKNFYTPFEKKLGIVENAQRIKIAVEETDEKCPDCKKGNLVVRTGKFGKFLSCSKFPDCKFTKAFVEKTGLRCPKDSAEIVIKRTRKGRKFYGCSNYPKCTFAAWKIQDIKSQVLNDL